MSLAKDAEFCKEVEKMQRETAELKLQLSAANKRGKEQEKDAADLKAQISAAHLSLAEAASKAQEAALQGAAKVEEAAVARINDAVCISTHRNILCFVIPVAVAVASAVFQRIAFSSQSQ